MIEQHTRILAHIPTGTCSDPRGKIASDFINNWATYRTAGRCKYNRLVLRDIYIFVGLYISQFFRANVKFIGISSIVSNGDVGFANSSISNARDGH